MWGYGSGSGKMDWSKTGVLEFRMGVSSQADISLVQLGIAYVIVTTVLFLFPPELPVTGSNMNYCIVAFFIILVISVVQWFVDGRRNYKGPQIEIVGEEGVHEPGLHGAKDGFRSGYDGDNDDVDGGGEKGVGNANGGMVGTGVGEMSAERAVGELRA